MKNSINKEFTKQLPNLKNSAANLNREFSREDIRIAQKVYFKVSKIFSNQKMQSNLL